MSHNPTIVNRSVRQLSMLIGEFYELVLKEHHLIKRSLSTTKDVRSNQLSSEVLRNRLELHRIYNSLLDDIAFVIAQNPNGKDLRRTLSYTQISKSLERLGNYASTIAFFIINNHDKPEYAILLKKVFNSAYKNLAALKNILASEDVDKIIDLIRQDDEVDKHYKDSLKKLITYKRELQTDAMLKVKVKAIIALRAIERIGDQVTSICESLYYISAGKRIDVWNSVLD